MGFFVVFHGSSASPTLEGIKSHRMDLWYPQPNEGSPKKSQWKIYGCWTKNRCYFLHPPNHPFVVHRVFHEIFNPSILDTPIFGLTPIWTQKITLKGKGGYVKVFFSGGYTWTGSGYESEVSCAVRSTMVNLPMMGFRSHDTENDLTGSGRRIHLNYTLPETNSKSTWKWMVGILVSHWDGLFSGAMLVLGRVLVSIFLVVYKL